MSETTKKNFERGETAQIRADSRVAEAIRRHPRCAAVFKRYGLNCHACVNSQVETVRSVCLSLGAPLEELLRELNIAAGAAEPNAARIDF